MLYSTSTRIPNMMGPASTSYEPFVAYATMSGDVKLNRKFEIIRDLETKAHKIEDALFDAGFNIARPVAFTIRIGQQPARFTIVGFVSSSDANKPPVTPTATIIHSGSIQGEKTAVMTPVQGTQEWGDEPTLKNRQDAVDLKTNLEAVVVGMTVFYVEYNGVKYGQKPNRNGFHSFTV